MKIKQLSFLFLLLSHLHILGQKNDSTVVQRNPFEILNKSVPEFSGTSLSGTHWNNHKIQGKVTMFTFWYIGCAGCMYEINSLNKLNSEFKNKNFILLSFAPQVKSDLISFNDSTKTIFSTLRKMFQADPIQYEIIPTCDVRKPRKDGTTLSIGPECDLIEKDFKVWGHPVTFIADKNGIIRYIHEGYSPKPEVAEKQLNQYKKEIDELMSQ